MATLRDEMIIAIRTDRAKRWTVHDLAQWIERPRQEVSDMIDYMMTCGDIRHEEGGYVDASQ